MPQKLDIDERHYLLGNVLYDRHSFDDPSSYDYPTRVPESVVARLWHLQAQLEDTVKAWADDRDERISQASAIVVDRERAIDRNRDAVAVLTHIANLPACESCEVQAQEDPRAVARRFVNNQRRSVEVRMNRTLLRERAEACHVCGTVTPWKCMDCRKPTCPKCEFTMFSMCWPCRQATSESPSELQPRADRYMRSEHEALFL